MSIDPNDGGAELYTQLTMNPLYVVDTEFCTHDSEHHLISIAIVPVIGGRRTLAKEELYREMNPGVPIDLDSSRIHGFTDEDVATKQPFGRYAGIICQRLADEGAVFVCHNTIDAHVLRAELARLDHHATAGEADHIGLGDLPNLPVIDTVRLAKAVGYPGIAKNAHLSLNKLCETVGVIRTEPAHNARSDARATADALIALLKYAAEHAVFWTFEDILDAASGGTLHEPVGPSHIRSRSRRSRRPLSAEHIAKHVHPLTDPVAAGSDLLERWLELAVECADRVPRGGGL